MRTLRFGEGISELGQSQPYDLGLLTLVLPSLDASAMPMLFQLWKEFIGGSVGGKLVKSV